MSKQGLLPIGYFHSLLRNQVEIWQLRLIQVKLAEYIALKEELDEEEIILIKVAALYHGMGVFIGPEDHEVKSCKLAKGLRIFMKKCLRTRI